VSKRADKPVVRTCKACWREYVDGHHDMFCPDCCSPYLHDWYVEPVEIDDETVRRTF